MAKKTVLKEEVQVFDKEYFRDIDIESYNDYQKTIDKTTYLFYESNISNRYNYLISKSGAIQKKIYYVHGCEHGNGKLQKAYTSSKSIYSTCVTCKYCGKSIDLYPRLYSKEIVKMFKGYGLQSTSKLSSQILFSKNPTNEDGVLIRWTEGLLTQNKTNKYKIDVETEVKAALEFIPGEQIHAYRLTKKNIFNSSALEAFNMNSTNINSNYYRNFLFENSNYCFDYFRNNMKFFTQTGLNAAFKYMPDKSYYSNEAFILLHLCLVSEYPMLETLLKMGYGKMYFDICGQMRHAQNQANMLFFVKKIKKMFNEGKIGADSLRVPNYIGEYLIHKASSIEEILIWCDIYEHQNLTKEQFLKLIESINFLAISSDTSLLKIPNVMKYGFKIEHIVKYIAKQISMYKKRGRNYLAKNILDTFDDYLSICELSGLETNKMPGSIIEAHDEIVKMNSEKKETYEKVEMVGKTAQKYLDKFIDPTKLTEMETKYDIVLPLSQRDFIIEGNNQNSCVGHYVHKVQKKERIVFFVRKKDEPNESFVTAEYVCETESLGQCMYRNNREVDDKDLLNYCRVTCNRIKTGLLNNDIQFE